MTSGPRWARFLAHFPGFGDQSSAASRIDDALDMLVVRATDGKRHYVGDLKPYATGPIYLAIPGVGTTAAGGPSTRMLAVLTTDGASGCQPLEDGRTVTVERYGDVDLRVPSDTGATGTVPACAVSGGFVLLGDVDSIKAALDARSQGRSVTGDPAYVSATRSLTGDHVATVFVDGHQAAALASAMPRPSTFPLPSGAPHVSLGSAQPLLGMVNDLPAWLAMGVRVTAGAVIVDSVMPDQRGTVLAQASGSAGRTPAPDAISAIAPALPASTIAVAELHQAGPLLEGLLARSGASASAGATASPAPNASQNLAQLQAALGFLGGSDALLGPLDQAAIVVISQADQLRGGVVIETADAASARTRLDQLRRPARARRRRRAGLPRRPHRHRPAGRDRPERGVHPPLNGDHLPAGGSHPGDRSAPEPDRGRHRGRLRQGRHRHHGRGLRSPTCPPIGPPSIWRAAPASPRRTWTCRASCRPSGLMVPAANLQAFDQEVSSWLKPIGSIAMGATSADGIVHGRLVVITP